MTTSFNKQSGVLRSALMALLFFSPIFATGATRAPLARVDLVPQEPLDVRAHMEFGASVAVIGGQAIVGAPGMDGIGAAYVFIQSGSEWSQTQKLVAPGMVSGRFGDRMVADATSAAISDTSRGLVYYFERSNGTGAFHATAVLHGGTGIRGFGRALAMQGCVLLIHSGTRSDDPPPGSAGFVHVYNRCPSGKWVWQGSFQAPTPSANDEFGSGLALNGHTLLVGAPGTFLGLGNAYAYSLINGKWVHQQTLEPLSRQEGDRFGTSASFAGTDAWVGSPGDPTHMTGEATYYTRQGTGPWSLIGENDANDGLVLQGSEVVVTNDRFLIAAHAFGSKPGAVYIYRHPADRNGYFLEDAVMPATQVPGDAFAQAFAVAGRALLVGDPGFAVVSGTPNGGAASIYAMRP